MVHDKLLRQEIHLNSVQAWKVNPSACRRENRAAKYASMDCYPEREAGVHFFRRYTE